MKMRTWDKTHLPAMNNLIHRLANNQEGYENQNKGVIAVDLSILCQKERLMETP